MSGFTESEILYLRVRNVLRRALGLASALAGAGLVIRGLLAIPGTGAAMADGSLGARPALVWLFAGVVCLLCGAIGLFTRSHRPDLGDRYPGRRTWWTGDPIDRIEKQPALTPRPSDSGG